VARALKIDESPAPHDASAPPVDVSVVVAVADRCGDLAEVYRAHAAVLERLGRAFEFLFVLEPWFEREAKALSELAVQGAPLRVIRMPRPFGESTALVVGFKAARGDVILTLPPWPQTEPEAAAAVLARLDAGGDLVVGRRWPRTDSWVNRAQSRVFHALTRRTSGVDLRDLSCGVRAMRKAVTREVRPYGDLHRFLPLLAAQRGFEVAEVDVPQHPSDRRARIRRPGVYLRRLLDIFTLVFLLKFIRKPLRFFGLVGAGLFGAGVLVCLALVLEKFLAGAPLADRPMLILGVLLMVLGVQVGSIGLLGEIIIFTHSRRMRDFTIREVLR
jgi:glycosyltransferase involved in cell wall biosynthesis